MRGEGRPGLRVLTTSSLDASTHGLSTTRNSAITECGRTTIGLNPRQLGTASLRSRARPIDLLSDVLGPPGFLSKLPAHRAPVRCVSREACDRGRPRRHMPTSTTFEFTSGWTLPPPGPCSPCPPLSCIRKRGGGQCRSRDARVSPTRARRSRRLDALPPSFPTSGSPLRPFVTPTDPGNS